jgi:molybdate transport system substrate-binding protein
MSNRGCRSVPAPPLARQIEQGAPADLFASADEQWMDYLAKRDLIAPDTRRSLLGNDLVLIVPASHQRGLARFPGFPFYPGGARHLDQAWLQG